MVTLIQLIRHGHHALLGRTLCGRMPGVELDESGCRRMERCAESLKPVPAAIQSSPQRRALQSAGYLARHFGVPIEIVPAFDEIDCGEWTGRAFEQLADDPRWSDWNTHRARSSPPGGESMRDLQRRVVDHLEQLRGDQLAGAVAIVSHAEPIRAALLHYCGIPLDDFLSIEIDPASISTLSVDRGGIRVAEINQQVPA